MCYIKQINIAAIFRLPITIFNLIYEILNAALNVFGCYSSIKSVCLSLSQGCLCVFLQLKVKAKGVCGVCEVVRKTEKECKRDRQPSISLTQKNSNRWQTMCLCAQSRCVFLTKSNLIQCQTCSKISQMMMENQTEKDK